MNERTTHFVGFAKLLWPEIESQLTANDVFLEGGSSFGTAIEAVEKLIAQRAYDLAYHTIYCLRLDPAFWGKSSPLFEQELREDLARFIPDLTAWPEQTEKPSHE